MPTVAPFDIEGHVIATHFLGDTPFFATAAGELRRLDEGEKGNTSACGHADMHQGPFQRLIVDRWRGRQGHAYRADGSTKQIAEAPRKWVNVVAGGPQGAVGYAFGKSSNIVLPDGTTKEIAEERTVEALAFAAKGLRIAAARYNGVSLHWINTNTPPTDLEWKGAHTGVTFSPDGRFLVTTMQENALHGWKLDGKPGEPRHMRMTGYPTKVKSYSWSSKGKWLATSGAPAAIVWPFSAKDGPMGKAPLELGTRANVMVTCVAFHPVEEVLAIGYIDGMVLGVRVGDGKEALLRRPGKGAITSMSWSGNGKLLAFGSQAGDCGVIDIAA